MTAKHILLLAWKAERVLKNQFSNSALKTNTQAPSSSKYRWVPLTHLFAIFLFVASNVMPISSGSCPSSLTACEEEMNFTLSRAAGCTVVFCNNF